MELKWSAQIVPLSSFNKDLLFILSVATVVNSCAPSGFLCSWRQHVCHPSFESRGRTVSLFCLSPSFKAGKALRVPQQCSYGKPPTTPGTGPSRLSTSLWRARFWLLSFQCNRSLLLASPALLWLNSVFFSMPCCTSRVSDLFTTMRLQPLLICWYCGF